MANEKKLKPQMSMKDAHDYNRIAADYNASIDQTESPEDFDRIPCILLMADGSVVLVDCKTLKPIKQ